MAKHFLEVFCRYEPKGEKLALLSCAHDEKYMYSKDPLRIQVELSFESHQDAEIIYEIEDECREIYGAESFKILPHFPSSEFTAERFSEIATEAALCGAVTNGFFSGAEYFDDGETITVAIPYFEEAIAFIAGSNTASLLSNILHSRYGITRKISIVAGSGAEERKRLIDQRRIDIMNRAEIIGREQFAV